MLTYYISSTPQLVPGAHIHVSGSLDGGVPFGGTPASPGWICSGGWANFQCDRAVPAGYVGPFLLLELHTTYPPSFLGHTFTYSGTATMGSNIDPNPANNTRTVTGPLH